MVKEKKTRNIQGEKGRHNKKIRGIQDETES